MATIPLVGAEARGKAGVFGAPTNPLQIYLQHQAGRRKQDADQFEYERQRRDKLIDDYEKWNPDKVWEPFYDEVNRDVNQNVRGKFFELSNSGMPISQIRTEMQRRHGDVNTRVNKVNGIRQEFESANATLNSDVGKYYKYNQTKSALRDVVFNGMHAKHSDEIDPTQFAQVYDNVDNFDNNTIKIDFMKSLPEKINEKYTKIWNDLGQQYNIQETKTKLGHQQDANGNVIMDPSTGMPMISMTDDVYIQALENPYINKILQRYMPEADATTQKQFLSQWLKGYDPNQIQNRQQLGFKEDQPRYRGYGGSFRVPIADLEDRDNILEQIAKGDRKDLVPTLNDPNSDNQAYYSDAKGKPAAATGKSQHITVAYTGLPDDDIDMTKWANMTTLDKVLYQEAKGRKVKMDVFDLSTAEGRRQFKIQGSRRMDKLDTKRAIGEDYGNFIEKKYQNDLKKKGSTESKEKGPTDPNWKGWGTN